MGYESPIAAALSSDGPGSNGDVVALAITGDYAAVVLVMPDQSGFEYVVICSRGGEGWNADSDSTGSQHWQSIDEDGEVGVLATWGHAPDGASELAVTIGGERTVVTVQGGYWLVLLEGASPDASYDGRVEVVS